MNHSHRVGLGDSLYPSFGNSGYRTKKYILNINVKDITTSKLDGLATIEAKATQSLSSFMLDFIGFSINGITVNGFGATYKRDGQKLIITPANPIKDGDSFTVQVNYSGSPVKLTSVAEPILTGWINYNDGSFVLGQPDGAANYYPVNDHPLDKAAYTFRITVPQPYQVAANGVLEKTIDNGNTTTYLFEARDPMASYLTTVNISRQFNLQTNPPINRIPIRNYFAKGIPQELLQPFSLQGAMLEFFSKTFGSYPFELYGSVVMNTKTGTALETQTLSIFGLDQLGINLTDLGGFSYSTEELVAHEIAHQWFGNSISLSDWKDIWLNESFATYSQGLWIEHSRGQEAFDHWLKNKYNTVKNHLNTLVPPGKPHAHELFNSGVYDWGALGLHALRLELGNDTFFKALQNYYSRYKGSNVTPKDFINIVEETSGKKLNAFFDKWFYSNTLADIPHLLKTS